jgi:LmbE family N-acetylglucosaminyl deacetylase
VQPREAAIETPMIRGLELRDSDRVLVVVPHPDDETLATGGLLQRALAAGAQVCVVVATDGDNNPWPQRWLERRWRIDATARERWGRRRREEARVATATLGIAAEAVRFLGWPDQGLTAMLMRDGAAEDQLRAELAHYSPSIVAMPSLDDRHPDHNALRVMLELALFRQGRFDCRRLGYVVHGPASDRPSLSIPLDAAQFANKQRALLAHATQLSLSRRRMQRLCERVECFEAGAAPSKAAAQGGLEWTFAWSAYQRWLHGHELLLIAEIGARIGRHRIALPRTAQARTWSVALGGDPPLQAAIRIEAGRLRVSLTCRQTISLAFAKIERTGARLVIYDVQGWQSIGGALQSVEAEIAQSLPAA